METKKLTAKLGAKVVFISGTHIGKYATIVSKDYYNTTFQVKDSKERIVLSKSSSDYNLISKFPDECITRKSLTSTLAGLKTTLNTVQDEILNTEAKINFLNRYGIEEFDLKSYAVFGILKETNALTSSNDPNDLLDEYNKLVVLSKKLL